MRINNKLGRFRKDFEKSAALSFLLPAIALVRMIPYLFRVRRDTDLHPVLRSYLGWMPLCIFSEPVLWLRKLATTRSRFQLSNQRPRWFYVPHLSALTLREPDRIARFLEENFVVIGEDFARISPEDEGVTPSKSLVNKGAWKTFELIRVAGKHDDNIHRVPKTWSVVEQCPLMGEVGGSAYFSIMYPGTHVSPHCGASNLKLRYHLTIVEAEDARIRSGGDWLTWHQGKCLILDDSIEHEVLHTGNERRVILIVDTWHPDLSEKERACVTQLHKIWRGCTRSTVIGI